MVEAWRKKQEKTTIKEYALQLGAKPCEFSVS